MACQKQNLLIVVTIADTRIRLPAPNGQQISNGYCSDEFFAIVNIPKLPMLITIDKPPMNVPKEPLNFS